MANKKIFRIASIRLSSEQRQWLRNMMGYYECDSEQGIIDRIIEEAYENYLLKMTQKKINLDKAR